MLKDLFSNRLFIGALAFFILCVGGSLLYMQHVKEQSAREMAAHEERLKELTARENQPATPAVSSVGAQTEPGHVHSDGTFHAEPHEPIAAPSEVSESEVSTEVSTAPQMQYNKGAGNPPPYDKVPVDLYDFEATKAAMIENVNFFMANWDPKTFFDRELGREMRIASAIASNIYTATYSLPIFLPEQAEELRTLYDPLYDIEGIERGRVSQLKREGHTLKEAIRIAGEETVERWGLE